MGTHGSNGTAGEFVPGVRSACGKRTRTEKGRESGAVFLPAWLGPSEEDYVRVRYTRGGGGSGGLEQKENKGMYESSPE